MDKKLSFQINATQVGETHFDIQEFTEEEYRSFERRQNIFPKLYKVVKYEKNRQPKIFIQIIIKQQILSQKKYIPLEYEGGQGFLQNYVDLMERQRIYENSRFTYTAVLLDIQDLSEVQKKNWEIQEQQERYEIVEKEGDKLLAEFILNKKNVKYKNGNSFNNTRENLLSKIFFQEILEYKDSLDYKNKQYNVQNQFEDRTVSGITIEMDDILIKPVMYKGQQSMFQNIEKKDNGLQQELQQRLQEQDQDIQKIIQQLERDANKEAQEQEKDYQVKIYLTKFSKEAKYILNKTRIMQQKIGETPLRSSRYNNCVLQQVVGTLYYGRSGEEKYIQKRDGRRLDFTKNNIIQK